MKAFLIGIHVVYVILCIVVICLTEKVPVLALAFPGICVVCIDFLLWMDGLPA
jgi:hypothetical protein